MRVSRAIRSIARGPLAGVMAAIIAACGGQGSPTPKPAPPVVVISPPGPLVLTAGQTRQLTASADFAGAVFVWTSSAPGIAGVDSSSGLVTAVAAGGASITASTQREGVAGSASTSIRVVAHQPGAPPDGTVYFGFIMRMWDALTNPAFGDQRPFAARYRDAIDNDLGGKTPTLFGVPAIWQEADGTMNTFESIRAQIDLYTDKVSAAGVPYLGWSAQTGWDNGSPGYSGITTRSIVAGSLDGYIEQFARDVRDYGKPILIRAICLEVNGTWHYHCSPGANPALTKSDFIDTWRRVVGIFNRVGATNVAWIWNVNTFPKSPVTWGAEKDIAGYYPGDDVVTWVGVDHYDFGDQADSNQDPRTPAIWLDPHYQFAVAHGKPVFLAEWGVRHTGSSLSPLQQTRWLNAMFDYFESHDQIKGLAYFQLQHDRRRHLEQAAVPRWTDLSLRRVGQLLPIAMTTITGCWPTAAPVSGRRIDPALPTPAIRRNWWLLRGERSLRDPLRRFDARALRPFPCGRAGRHGGRIAGA